MKKILIIASLLFIAAFSKGQVACDLTQSDTGTMADMLLKEDSTCTGGLKTITIKQFISFYQRRFKAFGMLYIDTNTLIATYRYVAINIHDSLNYYFIKKDSNLRSNPVTPYYLYSHNFQFADSIGSTAGGLAVSTKLMTYAYWVTHRGWLKDSAWLLTGNSGTSPGTNFIGTNDNAAFQINVGKESGYIDTIGRTNLGYKTLYKNTTGINNTALGYKALSINTTASGSVALGDYAGTNNNGDENLFNADSAGFANTSGVANTFEGYMAGSKNTSGGQNVAVGANALSSNTTGYYSMAMGYLALAASVNKNGQTALGAYCLQYTTGGNNCGVGMQALNLNTTGYSNSALGYQAGEYPGTNSSRSTYIGDSTAYTLIGVGEGNTFLGWHANTGATSGATVPLSNATAIGALSVVTASNCIHLGSPPTDSVVTSGIVCINNPITTVSGSTAGTVSFSQPFGGNDFKKIVIYFSAFQGTAASYTFPIAFTNTPGIVVSYGTGGSIVVLPAVVASLSSTSVTITILNPTTGYLFLEGN